MRCYFSNQWLLSRRDNRLSGQVMDSAIRTPWKSKSFLRYHLLFAKITIFFDRISFIFVYRAGWNFDFNRTEIYNEYFILKPIRWYLYVLPFKIGLRVNFSPQYFFNPIKYFVIYFLKRKKKTFFFVFLISFLTTGRESIFNQMRYQSRSDK